MSYSAGLFNLQVVVLLLQLLTLSFLLHSVVARKSCKCRNVALMVWWESLSRSARPSMTSSGPPEKNGGKAIVPLSSNPYSHYRLWPQLLLFSKSHKGWLRKINLTLLV